MARRSMPLTVDRLAALPSPCASCLFWEVDAVHRQRVCAGEEYDEKSTWVSTVLREWGSCGRVVVVDEKIVGYLIYAPAAMVPGVAGFPTAPVSPDAVVMTTAWVDPRHRGAGLGRILVQGMARDLIERGGIRAVEAFTDARGRTGHCVVPTEFCSRVGFRTHRSHPVHPRMRMDLRSALGWRDEVEAAVERLLGAVGLAPRPTRPAAPTRAHRHATKRQAM